MKTAIIIFLITTVTITWSCQKENLEYPVKRIEMEKYETLLNKNYDEALESHIRLTDSGNLSIDDFDYYMLMYHISDSLFSLHFYNFCIDLFKDESDLSGNYGMMGNYHGMMTSNGYNQGGSNNPGNSDTEVVFDQMNEIYQMVCNEEDPDYEEADSLMYNQMPVAIPFSLSADRIRSIFDKMQDLRSIHKSIQRN